VRRICRYFSLFALPLLCMQFATAQSSVDVGIGFGAAQDTKAKQGLDTTTLLNCTLGTPGCAQTPSLSAFMMGFSGDLMLWKHFGVGADVTFQPSKSDYVTLPAAGTGLTSLSIQSRTTFYDFKGIFQPVKTKRAALKLFGGIGGANIKFYESGTSNTALTGSQSFSQFFGSSNHFQVNGGAGVQIYVTEHMFIRPQFDVHYVRNLNQFGRNTVTEETIWIGYSFGQ
jgi:hypothetical protein